jgi:RNA-directed DNA polymerase
VAGSPCLILAASSSAGVSPASPALANICAWRADRRLSGLAASAGAVYTRYAGDLAFSGRGLERRAGRFPIQAPTILAEQGFAVHHRKTRILRHGVRQHLAGIVVNRRLNVIRADFDRLKAILTNSVRHGPESQNRQAHPNSRAHLEGRVSFAAMINPGTGKRLRAIFDRIDWNQ